MSFFSRVTSFKLRFIYSFETLLLIPGISFVADSFNFVSFPYFEFTKKESGQKPRLFARDVASSVQFSTLRNNACVTRRQNYV